mgnify:CR=1 FL=1|tara:strand:+ start:2199 stop:3059 length:861 start_codon:yes stop_codon:yes gene_type:complete
MRNHYVRAAAAASAGGNYVTDNLVFHLDAANTSCYSGSGTTVNSLVNNHTNDHFGDMQWDSDSGGNTGGYFYTDGTQTSTLQFPYSTDFEMMQYSSGGSTAEVTDYSWEWWWYGDSSPGSAGNVCPHFALNWRDGNSVEGVLDTGGQNTQYKGCYMLYRNQDKDRSHFRDGSNATGGNALGNSYAALLEEHTWTGSKWQHYVLTKTANTGSANNWSWYRDNRTAINYNQTFSTLYHNTSKKLLIFSEWGSGNRFDGRLGVMRFYQGKALTAAEVEQNYDAEKSRYT